MIGAQAAAQGPPSESSPSPPTAIQPDPRACAEPRLPTHPPGNRSDALKRDETVGEQPLSDQLARSDGVICPPQGVDPGIRAPTPDAGRTPIIPPPGSPGGDPSVRPK
jgi:hypothetical protein